MKPTKPPDVGRPARVKRHWSTYTSVSEWYADYQGYVPITMAHALSQVRQRHGLTFREAYRLLLDRGAIVHIDPADDVEPEGTPEP